MTFILFKTLHSGVTFSIFRNLASKVPMQPTWKLVDESKLPKVEIDVDLIDHLERLSLIEFNNQAGVDRLHKAVSSAGQLFLVNVDGVEPMDTVLEDRNLHLRADEVTEGSCRDAILMNAAKTEEEYFVAPPGNIPLKKSERDYGPSTSSEPP